MFDGRIISRNLVPLFKPRLWRVMRAAKPHSMVSRRRMQNLWRLLQAVTREGVPGDYVELGTARGGTALILARHARLRPDPVQVWLYDAFEDFEPPDAVYEDVRRLIFDEHGHDPECVHLVKGFFQETATTRPDRSIAFLHVDASGYEGVRAALEAMYPHVAATGAVIFDNYGVDEGCRRAVHELVDDDPTCGPLQRFGHSQTWFRRRAQA